MRGGPRSGAGRKPIPIDLVELEKLCVLQCTQKEMAAWFSCTERTIESYAKRPEVAEVMARGRAKGQISVRPGANEIARGRQCNDGRMAGEAVPRPARRHPA